MTEKNELLNRLVSSEVKAEILALFHKNPGLVDTLDGVARRVGRTAKSTEADVKDLVSLGVLRNRRIGRFTVLSLNRAKDRETQQAVAGYLRGVKPSRGG